VSRKLPLDVESRARRYVEKMPPAIEGQGGSLACWNVAQVLVKGFDLPRAKASAILDEYNQRCVPPWSRRELDHKLDSAATRSKMAAGFLATGGDPDWHTEYKEGDSPAPTVVVPIRPGLAKPGLCAPTPIEPDYGTDEWESWWLPSPVREWVEAAAAAFNVPLVMPIAAALCAASVVLQGKAKVRIHDAWEEELSLYWIVFAPTVSDKSGVMRVAIEPIRAMRRGIESRLTAEIAERSLRKSYLEAQVQRMRRKPMSQDKQERQNQWDDIGALDKQMREIVVPKIPEWLVTDANPTVIPKLMAHNLAAEGIARVSVCDSEGTFLANLMGRHSGQLNVDPMLAGYSGEPINMVRTLHGSADLQRYDLPSAHMAMCMMVQPHYLDLIREHPTLGDNGWLGRCIMSHVAIDNAAAAPYRRPRIPDDVQSRYAEWLTRLAEVDQPTVYEMPVELQPELERMHCEIRTNTGTSEAAAGWSKRSLGRICRIFAILGIDPRTPELPKPVGGARESRHEGIDKKRLNYIYAALYLRQLTRAQAIEPARRTLTSLASRALAALRRLRRFRGSEVTLAELNTALRSKRDDTLLCCDLLCQHGYLELLQEKRRHNNTLSVTYVVLSLGDDSTPEATPPVES
jgi:hypothetical protein